MRKLYTSLLITILSCFLYFADAQTISVSKVEGSFCLGTKIQISYSTDGKFEAGNVFKVQYLDNIQNIWLDMETSDMNGVLSAKISEKTPVDYWYPNLRIISSKPEIIKTVDKGGKTFISSALVNLSTDKTPAVNPYESVAIPAVISGQMPIVVTFTDSSKYVINGTAITLFPDKTKTYTIAKVSNVCGNGQGKGSTLVQVNPIGVKVVSVAPKILCVGDKIYVTYNKTGEFNPSNKFKIRISRSTNGSLSIYDFDAIDNNGTLTADIPFEVPKGYYDLKIISSNPEIVTAAFSEQIGISAQSSVWWNTQSRSILFGTSTFLNLNYTGIAPMNLTFSDGSTLFNDSGSNFNYTLSASKEVKPEKTTWYEITSFNAGCSSSIFAKEKVEIAVNEGIRTDSVLTKEICTGQKVRVRFASNAKFNPSNVFNVTLNEYYSQLSNIPATLIEPGLLEFVVPVNTFNNDQTWIPNDVNVAVNSTNPGIMGSKSLNTIKVKDLPFAKFVDTSNRLDRPQATGFTISTYGQGPYKLLMKDSSEYFAPKELQISQNSNYFSISGARSRVFELASVSNSCGISKVNSSYSLVIDNPDKYLLELGNVDKQGVLCEGEKKIITIKSEGNFQADNEFRIELISSYDNSKVAKTLGVSKSDGKVEVVIPNVLTVENYYLRISSTSPVVYSNTQMVSIQKKPELEFSGALSYTRKIMEGEVVTISTQNVLGGSPWRIELNDGSSGTNDYASASPGAFSFTKMPTASTSLYYVTSVSNTCGTTMITVPKKIDTVIVDTYKLYMGSSMYSYNDIMTCKGGKVSIPYFFRGNLPKSAKLSLQISANSNNKFKTIISNVTTNPYLLELPDTLSNSNYWVRIIVNNDSSKTYERPLLVNVSQRPSTELFFDDGTKSKTITAISGASVSVRIKSNKGSPNNVILGDEDGNVYPLNVNDYSYTNIPVIKSTAFTLKSVSNNCGYEVGNTQKLTLKVSSDFSASYVGDNHNVCAGGTFDMQIATIGDFGKDNKFSFYFFKTSDITNPKTLLASEYLGDNKYRITVPSDTPVNPYAIFVNSSGTGIQKDYQNLIFVIKAPEVVLTGSAIMNPGQSNNVSLQLYNSTVGLFGTSYGYSTFDYEISNNISGSTSYNYAVNSINIPAPLSTITYKLLSVKNACGIGKASGSATITINPSASKSIQIIDNSFAYSWTCTGTPIVVPFKTVGVFSSENKFTVQLSDDTGQNFRNLPTTGTTSPLKVIIPDSIKAGVGYKVRVVASDANVNSGTNLDLLRILNGPTAGIEKEAYSFEQGKPVSIKINLTGTPAWSITFGSDEFSARSYYVNSNPFVLDLNPVSSTTYKIFSVSDLYCKGVIPSAKSTTRLELITATEEFNEMGAKVFPNPTAEYINLALEKSQPALVRLTDSMGKLVLETSVSGYENKLDVSKLSSGTYLLLVEQGLNRSVFKIRKD